MACYGAVGAHLASCNLELCVTEDIALLGRMMSEWLVARIEKDESTYSKDVNSTHDDDDDT